MARSVETAVRINVMVEREPKRPSPIHIKTFEC